MENPLSFISELRTAPSAGLVKEMSCCKRSYTLTLPSGARSTSSSISHFLFEDQPGHTFLEVKYRQPCFAMPEMEVKLLNGPALKVRKKAMFSRSVMVFSEQEVPVLRIRRPVWIMPSAEYPILGDNGSEIGQIKKDWFEYDVYFPVDLDVRYKAALLASCIYMEFLNNRRHR